MRRVVFLSSFYPPPPSSLLLSFFLSLDRETVGSTREAGIGFSSFRRLADNRRLSLNGLERDHSVQVLLDCQGEIIVLTDLSMQEYRFNSPRSQRSPATIFPVGASVILI